MIVKRNKTNLHFQPYPLNAQIVSYGPRTCFPNKKIAVTYENNITDVTGIAPFVIGMYKKFVTSIYIYLQFKLSSYYL